MSSKHSMFETKIDDGILKVYENKFSQHYTSK